MQLSALVTGGEDVKFGHLSVVCHVSLLLSARRRKTAAKKEVMLGILI